MSDLPFDASAVEEAPISVLLVEDDHDLREVLRDALADEGFHVSDAKDGSVALELLRRGLQPSLVLLDWMMPVLNGDDFLERAELEGLLDHVAVVVMSAAARQVRARRPIVEIMEKPLVFDLLTEAITRHARRERVSGLFEMQPQP